MTTKADFIRRELNKLPQVEFLQDEAVILCCFHDDHNPSLRVSLTKKSRTRSGNVKTIYPGNFYCFSCGAGGGWNELAKKLKLETWDEEKKTEYADQPDNQFNDLARDLNQISTSQNEYVKPVTDGPWEGSWRGLSGSFLRSIGAESFWDKEYGEYRLYLPISDAFGVLVGHVLARGDNSKIPDKKKYLNSKGYQSRNFWYGLNFEANPKVIVIVEGPFDMLRFRSEGIPAIANLGVQLRNDATETVSDEKVMQLLSKGCTKVILALDADTAGRKAVEGFTASFAKWGIEVYDLNLSRYLKNPDDKMDPGNAPMEVIQDLKSFVNSL